MARHGGEKPGIPLTQTRPPQHFASHAAQYRSSFHVLYHHLFCHVTIQCVSRATCMLIRIDNERLAILRLGLLLSGRNSYQDVIPLLRGLFHEPHKPRRRLGVLSMPLGYVLRWERIGHAGRSLFARVLLPAANGCVDGLPLPRRNILGLDVALLGGAVRRLPTWVRVRTTKRMFAYRVLSRPFFVFQWGVCEGRYEADGEAKVLLKRQKFCQRHYDSCSADNRSPRISC